MKVVIMQCLVLLFLPLMSQGYPLYGSEELGIRRLEAARLAHEGAIRGSRRPAGELLSRDQVDLRLLAYPELDLPTIDAKFSAQISRLLGKEAEHYSLSLLDLSDPEHPRYAEHNGAARRNPGSVGKIIAALGFFQALADAYPDDPAQRRAILRDTRVIADGFIVYDHHKVRLWNPRTRRLKRRPLQLGDEASLWEYLDWMLSASSNAAAAMVMQQAMLLRRFGRDYPLSPEAVERFFRETPRKALGELFIATFHEPVTRNGLDLERLRQGSFFTRAGKRKVPGTTSHASTREMLRLLLRMEQGRLVDLFSSRELKRLLYMTERRIRYASAPALRDAAVYFKSGSLYSCKPEPGFKCRKYMGNRKNLMNSVAIVESPADQPQLYYMATLTSNVLRENSAVAHQTLATRIHRLLQRNNPAKR
ncbi:MAG: serine hydrolase [Pseudomonadota bacterium]